MIEVIRPKFMVECSHCKSILRLSLDEPEVTKIPMGTVSNPYNIHMFDCPHCGGRLELERCRRAYEKFNIDELK